MASVHVFSESGDTSLLTEPQKLIIPSKRRLPMCRMAASSLEISQFSVSVNMRTFMADRMLE